MELKPKIFNAEVMHKRFFPKINQFTYKIYYLSLPIDKLSQEQITEHINVNQFSTISFYEKDHGLRDGSNLESWIRNILSNYDLNKIVESITLITMPRILGYVFNPVSFWMCHDKDQQLRAVLCEVNNTFGESHTYLCAHENHHPIKSDDWLIAEKLFHVSPFLKREGEYHFRFSSNKEKLGFWINFYDESGNKQLETNLLGSLKPLTKKSVQQQFWTHPLVTFKAIFLIHYQALKLISKGIKHISKPKQKNKKLSSTKNLTKM